MHSPEQHASQLGGQELLTGIVGGQDDGRWPIFECLLLDEKTFVNSLWTSLTDASCWTAICALEVCDAQTHVFHGTTN